MTDLERLKAAYNAAFGAYAAACDAYNAALAEQEQNNG
jgi:hypothetical protein